MIADFKLCHNRICKLFLQSKRVLASSNFHLHTLLLFMLEHINIYPQIRPDWQSRPHITALITSACFWACVCHKSGDYDRGKGGLDPWQFIESEFTKIQSACNLAL